MSLSIGCQLQIGILWRISVFNRAKSHTPPTHSAPSTSPPPQIWFSLSLAHHLILIAPPPASEPIHPHDSGQWSYYCRVENNAPTYKILHERQYSRRLPRTATLMTACVWSRWLYGWPLSFWTRPMVATWMLITVAFTWVYLRMIPCVGSLESEGQWVWDIKNPQGRSRRLSSAAFPAYSEQVPLVYSKTVERATCIPVVNKHGKT